MVAELRLELLGGMRITLDGGGLPRFVSSKAPALLCYLAVTARPQFRSTLAGLLWSDLPEDVARRNLRIVLANLRQILPTHLIITRETIAFDRTRPYWLDVEQMEAALHPAVTLAVAPVQAAVALYGGDFLEGFYVRDAPLFDEWATAQRERLRQRLLHALHELVSYHTAQGAYAAGIDAATRLLQLDPWREDAHQHLMRLLALSGQPGAALAQYTTCCRVLEAELGADVSAETTRLYEQIRDGLLVPVPVDEAPAILPDLAPPRPPTLPALATSLIGRELERTQIAQRLADATCRLLTLVGPGGIGKTELALHAAADHAAAFPDGVVWVPLAAAESPDQMITGLAEALGLTLHSADDPQHQVRNYLREKRLLLVLDNLEQLREAGRPIQAILAAAPQVVVLATSREPLHLQQEWLLDLRGLPYPVATHEGASSSHDQAQLEQYAAVQLFVRRATQVQPDWTLDAATLPAVIRICQLVQGMPLGIQLAAVWVRTIPCAEIADEVAQNLDFLATTLWDVPARHRSLRAVFDYSWQWLNAEGRTTLAQLAVFRGGFGGEAARAVAGADPRRLAALLDTSLLGRDGSGRYVLHELVRQFAAEHLAHDWPAAADATQGRHSRYYLDFVQAHETALRGPAAQQSVTELSADLDNIRQAWAWAVAHAQVTTLDRATRGLTTVYELLGLVGEGTTVFEAASEHLSRRLAAPASPDRAGRRALGKLLVAYARFLTHRAQFDQALAATQEARAVVQAASAPDLEAVIAHQSGQTLARHADYGPARAELEHALALARAAELPEIEVDCLSGLAETAVWQGDLTAGVHYHRHALALYRVLGNTRGEGSTLKDLGLIALLQGDYATAETYETAALQCIRAVGSRMDEAFVLLCLGQIAVGQGAYLARADFFEQALHLYREIGNRHGEILAQAYRGYVPLAQGDYPAARAAFEHALRGHRAIADRRGESDMLANLGLVAHLTGDDATALTLTERALALAQQIGNPQFQARAMTFRGHALVGVQRLAEATTTYEAALALRQTLQQPHLAVEARAGLARVALAQEDLPRAQAYVADIREYLATGTLDGTFEPARIYLTCYEVLCIAGDPQATDVLQRAHGWLDHHAAAISDIALRRAFLENVTAHQAIADEYSRVLLRV